MWTEIELSLVNGSLHHFTRMWEFLLKNNGYDCPRVDYRILENQKIEFGIHDLGENNLFGRGRIYIEVCCECNSPLSAIKDCQLAFGKRFG